MSEFKNLITLTRVSDGAPGEPGAPGKDGGGYYIQTNQEEVLYLYEEKGFLLSPQTLEISLYELPLAEGNERIDFSNSYDFGYITTNGSFVSLIDEKYNNYFSIGTEEGAENILFYDLQNLSWQENSPINNSTIFKFVYFQDGEEVAIKIISSRLGISEDMAQFSVEARKINAAVGDSYLSFDDKGLSLYVNGAETNEGLKIYRRTEENGAATENKVFWADERGNLNIIGHIQAESGSFTGDVHALNATFENGEIGGFKIEGSRLVSQDENHNITLDGSQGIIEAKSIKLGIGATIESYIQLGNARLYNPNYSEAGGTVLQSGDIAINQNGTANFGSIQIDGRDSKIEGANWKITSDYAEFNNILISGSIETAVFKTGTTQAAGGTVIFRPSYELQWDENINEYVFEGDLTTELNENKLGWIVEEDYKKVTITSLEYDNTLEKTKVTFLEEANLPRKRLTFIYLSDDKEAIIAINSGNSSVAGDLIKPCGLTITKLDATNPNLFLGDLSKLGNISYTGHGLYADNVYLNGSLTTKVGENSYAGVNTLNGVFATAFKKNYEGKTAPTETDVSKIVFWAGADSTKENDIQKAYFQVTEQGSIYASRAKLESSLFVGGRIEGTDIYTARIHGTGDGTSPALTIYDTSGGISFKTGYKNDNKSSGTETFSIQNDGLKSGEDKFVSIGNSWIEFIGDKIRTKGTTNYLSLTVKDSIPVLYHEHSNNQNCGFYFGDGKTSYKITSNDQTQTRMVWSSNDTKLLGTITFAKDEEDTNFQYRSVEDGYDLYISV